MVFIGSEGTSRFSVIILRPLADCTFWEACANESPGEPSFRFPTFELLNVYLHLFDLNLNLHLAKTRTFSLTKIGQTFDILMTHPQVTPAILPTAVAAVIGQFQGPKDSRFKFKLGIQTADE